jgi:hypothetical protein
MIIIHNLDTEKVYLADSVEKAKNKTDRIGIEEVMESKETVVIGRTIYEYNRALEHFVEKQGCSWKAILRKEWFDGIYPNDTPKVDIPSLQRLRNSIGSL